MVDLSAYVCGINNTMKSMSLLKRLFGRKEKPISDDRYFGFDIEYLPRAKRYFPRYMGRYLEWCSIRQDFTLETSPSRYSFASTRKKAKKMIDMYLELRGVGSEIIKKIQ